MSPELAARNAPVARIANARGVPGTVGGLVTAPGDGAMLLTSHHVLFGAGAEAGEPVWSVGEGEDEPDFRRVGVALRGRLGTVIYMGAEHHVDCALVALDRASRRASRQRALRLASPRPPRPGDRVFKLGGATGATEGVVVDVEYPAVAELHGRTHAAPRQILVGALDGAGPFSAPGDSGAALRDVDGAAVGLLWGATDRGESLACHIGPVLDCLGVLLTRPRRAGPLARFRAPTEVVA
ncbi:MAG TPA: trypsin-like peptidase domain-containing protein [Solirubrobacterales bacterium]|nr:trypsin-like peptidase domain-containing protein [Solirubrobacterales bacterium]